ncbi:hypothetical protein FPRO04_13914 [Fusarium proliferatum]|nr:hypothetical protein FPRO04_13914 [Fusarium proliferatum]
MARTSNRYHFLVSRILYKRISVCVNHHVHICKVIRRLQPHLSIAQKKLLKKEGEYEGQQEEFSKSLDPDAVPPYADCVRQMIVGSVKPGRKNKPIIMRYLEEVMKNLHNLEVFEGHNFTESMSKSLVTQNNLKSLYLSFYESRCFKENAFTPLGKIRGLEHLRVESFSIANGEKVVSSMLVNSLTTLQSLNVSASFNRSIFMDSWEEDIKAYDPKSCEQIPRFTSLRSLSLSQITFNSKLTKNLSRAVDFLRLKELEINRFGDSYRAIGKENLDGHPEFFKYLETLFHMANKADIHLRNLSLQISGWCRKQRFEIEEDLGHIYRFLSSFDTLICLEIHSYNTYWSEMESNPGLLQQLQQSILKHQGLEILHFHYRNVLSGHEVPCVTAASVAVLVKNLPKLRVLEFAPSGGNEVAGNPFPIAVDMLTRHRMKCFKLSHGQRT